MVRDPRPWLILAAATFGVWSWLGFGPGHALMAALGWTAVAWLGALTMEIVRDDRRKGVRSFGDLMPLVGTLGLALVVLGDTGPALLNAVYAVPEQFRGVRMPYYGVFDGDWWNAAWVWPTAAGLGSALVFGPVLHLAYVLAHVAARRW